MIEGSFVLERTQEKKNIRGVYMESHAASILQLRRVGGVAFASMSKADRFSANEFFSELLGCINGIDMSGDEADAHPPNICVKYRLVVCWYSSALAEGRFFSENRWWL